MTDPILTVRFVQPCKPLTLNERLHWRPKNDRTQLWRYATAMAAVQASGPKGPSARRLPAAVVQCSFDVFGNYRRDPHNWFATVKPVVDGLVQAGLWPDDTPEWVRTVEPRLTILPVPRRGQPLPQRWCTVAITPMEP